jgi:capsular polysaccharide transport system permease protein
MCWKIHARDHLSDGAVFRRFFMVEWLEPHVGQAVLWAPPVHGMEMMRYGVFGDAVFPHFDWTYLWPFACRP